VLEDYPVGMQLRGLDAYVPVRLSIDASGNATNCVIQQASIDAASQAVCKNLVGKFEPALDKDGHPVPSIFNTGVMYSVGY
jgi:hypothetical protein